jgi:biotin transport system substrate-specific component
MTTLGTVRSTPELVLRRALAVTGGVLLVALGAQAAIPLPMTPVPLTLQGPAVLVVGALLGPALGASSMVLYLWLGAVGLPVFAPVGAPGLARLMGPTGGYLLAFPVAAAIAGQIIRDGRSWPRLAVGLLAGLAAIYAGGIAQLAALGGDLSTAARIGSLPFLVVDLCKLIIAGLVIRWFGAPTHRLV